MHIPLPKVRILGVNTSLCNWILDYFTSWPCKEVLNDDLTSRQTRQSKLSKNCFFLLRLKKIGMSVKTFPNWYWWTIESILSGCLTAWCGMALEGMEDSGTHHKLPPLLRAKHLPNTITQEYSHWNYGLFPLLPSVRRCQIHWSLPMNIQCISSKWCCCALLHYTVPLLGPDFNTYLKSIVSTLRIRVDPIWSPVEHL